MRPLPHEDVIYDWNGAGAPFDLPSGPVAVLDETLRDGLQSPSVRHPSLNDKVALLHAMERAGIDVAKVGLPGSSRRAFEDCVALCRTAAEDKLRLIPACAGRTIIDDIAPIADIVQSTGSPVEVYAFVGSSPIRAIVEGWDLSLIKKLCAEAIAFAVRENLNVTFVTEDTTRSRPEVLARLFRVALDHGASRICLCDTVGHATPKGARELLHFTHSVIAGFGAHAGIDWHGHNDRGLALPNALAAIQAGADRVHGTALGVGERVGNAAIELILLNLELLGVRRRGSLAPVRAYCELASQALDWPIPQNYPLVGRDAFRTAAGVHAAAIAKALAHHDSDLADCVYGAVPASLVGREQEICIGPMSGASNVVHWLERHGIDKSEELVAAILRRAKASNHVLSDAEIRQVLELHRDTSSDEDQPGAEEPS